MAGSQSAKSPAVDVAKDMSARDGNNRIFEVEPGVRVRLRPVSASLIDDVTSRIPEPDVPMWHNKDKDRDEPNPSDPGYLIALEQMNRKRGIVAMDAMVMFGAELVDGLPASDEWLRKLKWMERHNMIDLSGYDLDDELDREFVYKRYVAVTPDLLAKISEVSGISSQEVERAEKSFPSST